MTDEKNYWGVARRYHDFYLLERKLTEFHGVFSDARLPPRRSAATAKNIEFLQSVKKDFEYFLRVTHRKTFTASIDRFSLLVQHLLMKPTLRHSELLYNFLTQPDEFTLPNGEIILAKMIKVVPRRLRIEVRRDLLSDFDAEKRRFSLQKGQYLDPFLISLINYAEANKPKASHPAPIFVDLLTDKVRLSSMLHDRSNRCF